MSSSLGRQAAGLAAAAALSLAFTAPAADAAGSVSVTVNGNALALNPAPTERAGRVFVPLRSVFENLGASVVYQAGQINATGRGHNISLRIGSTQATVDGQTQTIDVAPFIIGASTYVPLRFVSQALGATVNWDGTNRIVAITAGAGGQTTYAPPPNAAQNQNGNQSPVRIRNLLPRDNATIQGNQPTIQASFEDGNADPNSVHVVFDGRDVTNRAYISPQGVTFTPRSTLPAGQHTVQIQGRDTAGAAFSRQWSFTTGGGTSTTNAISDLSPAPGSTVPSSFTLRGRTAPGSTVTVQVGVTQQAANNLGQVLGAILGVGGGGQGVQTTVTAGPNGRFEVPISISASSGSVLGVVITSTEPNYGVAAQPQRFNLQLQ